MAVAFVSSGTGNWVAASSFSVTKPTGSAAGDVILILWTSNGVMTGSLQSSGFTASQQNVATPDGQTAGVLIKLLDGTEGSTFTVTNSSSANSSGGYMAVRYSGVGGSFSAATAIATPAQSTSSNTSPVSMSGPSFTTTVANTVLATFYTPDATVSGSPGTFTPTGQTTRANAGSAKSYIYLCDSVQVAAGASGTKAASLALSSGSAGWMSWTIALPPPQALTSTLAAPSAAGAARSALVSGSRAAAAGATGIVSKSAAAARAASSAVTATRSGSIAATRAAASATSSSIARVTALIRSGAASAGGLIGKAIIATRSAAQTAAATVSSIRGRLLSLSASLASTGLVTRAVTAKRSAATAGGATLRRGTAQAKAAASAASALIGKGTAKTAFAAQASAAAISKSIALIRSAASALTALFTKTTSVVVAFVPRNPFVWHIDPRRPLC